MLQKLLRGVHFSPTASPTAQRPGEAGSHGGVFSASWSSRNKAVQKVLTEAAILLSADDTIASLQSSKSLLWNYLGGTMDKKEERNQNLGQR